MAFTNYFNFRAISIAGGSDEVQRNIMANWCLDYESPIFSRVACPGPSTGIANDLGGKSGLCSGQDFWHLADLSRLGIDKIMVTDGPHGLRKQAKDMDHLGAHRSVPATCFPTASALASPGYGADSTGWRSPGSTCVDEDVSVLLGPGLNIKRSPLCGRNLSTFRKTLS